MFVSERSRDYIMHLFFVRKIALRNTCEISSYLYGLRKEIIKKRPAVMTDAFNPLSCLDGAESLALTFGDIAIHRAQADAEIFSLEFAFFFRAG